MKHNKLFVLMAGLMLLSLILTACGGSADSGFPAGKYVAADNEDAGMIFKDDGTWSAFSGIYTLARGTYSVEGDVYTEVTNNSDGNCPVPFDFKYTFDGKNLTFNYIGDPSEDPCDGRKDGFDNKTYILSEK